jgi:UDP-N-acetylglucosamine diphosphorylase/glucosamine-1-phosphate N-acetyltransferase
MKTICIYEDEKVSNFNPLVYLRPIYDLRCGVLTLREKIIRRFPDSKIILQTRQFLEKVVTEENPDLIVNKFDDEKILFINGRLILPDVNFIPENIGNGEILFTVNGEVAAAYLFKGTYSEITLANHTFDFTSLKDKLPVVEISGSLLEYPWDLVYNNGSEIERDFVDVFKTKESQSAENFEGVFASGEKIFIGKNVKIHPTVVIDASEGVVIIDDGAEIMPQSTLLGPVYVGKESKIKIGAKIYHDTTIGEVCKVGGEVENSIIHSYSNKQHDGFLGHAYLAQWVNLGAGTNNSDLKNNYGSITVKINNRLVNTGLQFVGLIMGDHSKTAIGTQFNTGTVVGVSSNIFGQGFPPRYIPSFSWGGSEFLKEYKLEKASEVAGLVMQRRSKEFTEAQKELLGNIFRLTETERKHHK